jgi:hypothetical protein
MLWWPSGYDCFRDETVGCDDHYSISIKREEPSTRGSAWSTLSWGWPFSEHRRGGRRFRFGAMVKTADCTGMVRLGHYSSLESIGDIYYGGRKSHKSDGTPVTDGIVWEYSHPLTGTNDWTPVSMEFVVKHHGSTLVLEQTGTGQCWFDNVVIEELARTEADDGG